MPHPGLSAAVGRLTQAVAKSSYEDASDGQLLGWFITGRDESAFAELVRRLGPMVLGVCRRLIGDDHLAEDAFQAVFVVLARRAADVRPREAVRGWLYGVAVRVAKKARVMSTRRRGREVPVPSLPDRAGEAIETPDADMLRILDEEVAALPGHMRAAVLCELDNISRKDAATRLGVALGTLSSRLARAHRILAERLRARGVALSAVALSVSLAQASRAAVPPGLSAKAVRAALSPDPLPATVATLSHGVLRTMFFRKLLLVPALGLLATVALAGGLLPAANSPTESPAAVVTAAAPTAPEPRVVGIVADTKLEDAPPVVVKTVPESGADGVDPALTEIKVTFSKTMTDKSWSWSSAEHGEFPVGKESTVAYDENKRVCTATVKLEPGTTYAIWLNSEKYHSFKDADGRTAVPYLLVFRTKAK